MCRGISSYRPILTAFHPAFVGRGVPQNLLANVFSDRALLNFVHQSHTFCLGKAICTADALMLSFLCRRFSLGLDGFFVDI